MIANRCLWIDVGPLFRHEGNVAGIQRVAICVIQEWLVRGGLPLRFCGYDAAQGIYREIDRQAVVRLLAEFITSRKTSAFPAWLRPPGEKASPWARRALRIRQALGRGVCRLRGQSSSSGRAPFDSGDVLFLPLNSWNAAGIAEALADASTRCGVRLIPLLYDVIPLTQPHLVHRGKTAVYGDWVRNMLRLSAGMITISQHSRREIIDVSRGLGIAAPPVEVVRLGDELPAVVPRRPGELPAEIDQGFVLCLGSICQRKNQMLLLHVWRRLIERHGANVPSLVLVGRVERSCEAILRELQSDASVRDRLFVLQHAPDTETHWLLEHCCFTMFPSHYEGWGLPVAESLARGKYCIASGSSSLPEIAGDLIDYHSPGDVEGCAKLAEQALFTPGFVADRERRIREQFRVTSWQSCAAAILRCVAARAVKPAGSEVPRAA